MIRNVPRWQPNCTYKLKVLFSKWYELFSDWPEEKILSPSVVLAAATAHLAEAPPWLGAARAWGACPHHRPGLGK
jgi:hypothetical protein